MRLLLILLAYVLNYALFAWLSEDLNPFAWGAVPYMIWCGVMMVAGLLVLIRK